MIRCTACGRKTKVATLIPVLHVQVKLRLPVTRRTEPVKICPRCRAAPRMELMQMANLIRAVV